MRRLWTLAGSAIGMLLLSALPVLGQELKAAGQTCSSGPVTSEASKGIVPRLVPDEVLIRFNEGVTDEQILHFEKAHALNKRREFPHLRVRQYRLPPSIAVEVAIALYSESPLVEY